MTYRVIGGSGAMMETAIQCAVVDELESDCDKTTVTRCG